jgi:hypothetical protein
MSIPLTGTEGLFTRLGKIFGLTNLLNTQRGTDVPPHVDSINAQYENTDQNLVTNLYSNLLSYQNSNGGFPSNLQQLAQGTITQMANDAIPQTSLSSLQVCMNAVINQMLTSGSTVQACTVSGSVAAGASNSGNAVVAVSLWNGLGYIQENSFAELIRGTVTNDAQSGSATAGREQITFLGQYPVSDPLSWLYPVGSGASQSVTCIDATQSQGRGIQNNLNNSNFESWTSTNIPSSWNILVGTAGSTVFQSSGQVYDGTWSLEYAGDGSELTSLYQQFATKTASGDTSAIIAPLTQYAINAFVSVNSAPSQGVIEFSLTDNSNAIINSETGVPNLVSADLTSLSSAFVPVTGFFQTPRVLPTAIRLRVRLSTALQAGHNVFIDHLAMAQPAIFYPGGPSIAAFSASKNLINGDTYNITISNNYSGQFQRLFDRFFNMKSLSQSYGLLLPSSQSPTIPDSLIS